MQGLGTIFDCESEYFQSLSDTEVGAGSDTCAITGECIYGGKEWCCVRLQTINDLGYTLPKFMCVVTLYSSLYCSL